MRERLVISGVLLLLLAVVFAVVFAVDAVACNQPFSVYALHKSQVESISTRLLSPEHPCHSLFSVDGGTCVVSAMAIWMPAEFPGLAVQACPALRLPATGGEFCITGAARFSTR